MSGHGSVGKTGVHRADDLVGVGDDEAILRSWLTSQPGAPSPISEGAIRQSATRLKSEARNTSESVVHRIDERPTAATAMRTCVGGSQLQRR